MPGHDHTPRQLALLSDFHPSWPVDLVPSPLLMNCRSAAWSQAKLERLLALFWDLKGHLIYLVCNQSSPTGRTKDFIYLRSVAVISYLNLFFSSLLINMCKFPLSLVCFFIVHSCSFYCLIDIYTMSWYLAQDDSLLAAKFVCVASWLEKKRVGLEVRYECVVLGCTDTEDPGTLEDPHPTVDPSDVGGKGGHLYLVATLKQTFQLPTVSKNTLLIIILCKTYHYFICLPEKE